MKKSVFLIISIISILTYCNVQGQEIQESCKIIETSIKGGQYKDFTFSGDGFLTYTWGDNNDSETQITIDLIKVTISKDLTFNNSKVWINCIGGNNCICEKGKIANQDGMYFTYPKTYLPANNESDMKAMFLQLDYLIHVA